jgi:hypothetical protein
MNTQESTAAQQGQKKEVTIYVNGRPKMVEKTELSFDVVVRLAFPNPQPGPDYEYTVTYSKGHDPKKEGTLVAGQTVKVKEGMIFNVTETNKS